MTWPLALAFICLIWKLTSRKQTWNDCFNFPAGKLNFSKGLFSTGSNSTWKSYTARAITSSRFSLSVHTGSKIYLPLTRNSQQISQLCVSLSVQPLHIVMKYFACRREKLRKFSLKNWKEIFQGDWIWRNCFAKLQLISIYFYLVDSIHIKNYDWTQNWSGLFFFFPSLQIEYQLFGGRKKARKDNIVFISRGRNSYHIVD